MLRKFVSFHLLVAVLLCDLALPAQGGGIRGRVEDESGAPVAFARVIATYPDGTREERRTSRNGDFSFPAGSPVPDRIQVISFGHAPFEKIIGSAPGELLISLRPFRLADSVTVVATQSKTPISSSTQSVSLLSREDQDMSPSQTVDDYLRRIPGFTLFRRSSSLVAHPTAQGVSMRGVGPSGASRTLVLADGVPLNDPFGGWVYWSRVPRIAIDRIELLRGGASELYGTDALGGVIQLFRRPNLANGVRFEGYLGSWRSADASILATYRMRNHSVSLAGEFFRTDGYPLVAARERGTVDIPARSEHHAVEAIWDYGLKSGGRLYAIGSEFSERRGNGTPLQNNDTQIRSLVAGVSFPHGKGTLWNLQAFALRETFDGIFTAIAPGRDAESPTRSQRVPAQSAGLSGSWRRTVGKRHMLLAGADFVRVRGASDELIFSGGRMTGASRAEGRQDRSGVYVQDLFRAASRLQLVFGARWDSWVNHDAFSFFRSFSTGAGSQTPFPSRSRNAWSPKIAARLDLIHDLSLRGSLSRSFRAPTLNELYRPFRVGNVVTNANPELEAERATSWEIGADWGLRSPLAARATYFWTDLEDNVANVTLQATPVLVTRQRQNLGETRSRGLELDLLYRPDTRWMFSAGYLFADAAVRSAPAAPELTGLRLPQVPRHLVVLNLSYREPRRFNASALLRASSRQFEDDQNLLALAGFHVVDLSVGKPLSDNVELFFACENLMNRSYAVGRTPVETLGMPRRLHGGIRVRLED